MESYDNMKLVPVDHVKEGMLLAKTVYSPKNYGILLKEGTKFTSYMIKRIKQFKIPSVYIIVEGIGTLEINEAEKEIKLDVEFKVLNKINSTFCMADKNSSDNINKIKTCICVVKNCLSVRNVLKKLVVIHNIDICTYNHCVNVAALSFMLGVHIGLNECELYELFIGALLHDFGKVLIPKELLLKNKKLSDEEFDEIKHHAIKGYKCLERKHDIPDSSKKIILQHHERYDGQGYPSGLKGEGISKMARIVSIADIYDALISDRPFRKAMSLSEGIEYILACGGTQLDYMLVLAFSRAVIPYTIGMVVKLSNGLVGIIQETYPSVPLRPKIKLIVQDHPRNGETPAKYIDLRQNLNIVITSVLQDPKKQMMGM